MSARAGDSPVPKALPDYLGLKLNAHHAINGGSQYEKQSGTMPAGRCLIGQVEPNLHNRFTVAVVSALDPTRKSRPSCSRRHLVGVLVVGHRRVSESSNWDLADANISRDSRGTTAVSYRRKLYGRNAGAWCA